MITKGLLKYYPIAAKLSGKLVVVIGGGKVAQRKIRRLLKSEAKIYLISPTATRMLANLAKKKQIRWIRRNVRSSDIEGACLIIAATDDDKINKKASQWARKHQTWINVVDRTELCDFISPALFRADKTIITVYTDGRDPVLSRDLKNYLKERWNDFLSYRNRL